MNEILLLQGAQADLLNLYSRHGDEGYRVIDEELELIRGMPQLAPMFSDPFRRRVVQGTPFGIFYTITGSRVVVTAVLDLRQNPESILRRLQQS